MTRSPAPTPLDPVALASRSSAPADARPRALAVVTGTAAMTCVGGSVAVSAVLDDAPLATTQSLRYAVACLLLAAFARLAGRTVVSPRGVEWWWLLGTAGAGLLLFNVALVRGSRHAEPAALAVAVACVPLVFATVAPLLEGRRPRPLVLGGAVLVTAGAVIVQGLGRTDAVGLVWAVVVLASEAGFTLLAVPVLRRHGPWGVFVHTTWLAAGLFGVGALALEGPRAPGALDAADLLAVAYLAVVVTALAFVWWYGCVQHLGAARAGLLTGVAPVAAAAAGAALGGGMPSPGVWLGVAVVGTGLAGGPVARAAGSSGGGGLTVAVRHSPQVGEQFPGLVPGCRR